VGVRLRYDGHIPEWRRQGLAIVTGDERVGDVTARQHGGQLIDALARSAASNTPSTPIRSASERVSTGPSTRYPASVMHSKRSIATMASSSTTKIVGPSCSILSPDAHYGLDCKERRCGNQVPANTTNDLSRAALEIPAKYVQSLFRQITKRRCSNRDDSAAKETAVRRHRGRFDFTWSGCTSRRLPASPCL
jgi:hypothetical protein